MKEKEVATNYLLRTSLHRNPMQNWDIANVSEGCEKLFCGSGWMEGLGFNLCVAPTDSLCPSIS